ncbi:MAG: DNA integrity scanning protein DisA nucleotide-binding domain protein [Actinomycetota bacterium]|nr:DNA integrity scanning protein DisA nucleotide-binding domain protein [Actinomycetota bacterium]
MREEERQIAFRLILVEPELIPPEDGPPAGLHRLEFQEPRPFDEHELRRLSPAAPSDRSLIGVRHDGEKLEIWGLVHSGPRWLQRVRGGRDFSPPMPEAPVVRITGPGRIVVDRGSTMVGKLEGGRLSDDSMDVFRSEWLPAMFATVRSELLNLHLWDREKAEKPWADLDLDVTRRIAQHMIRRIISTARNSGHGGTLIIVPPHCAEDLLSDRYVALKHKFTDEEPRRRYRSLITSIMNTLAEIYGQGKRDRGPVGWREYRKSGDERLSKLDEAIFEMSHLIAGLMAVDGAAVMTQRYEILGFGGEISGDLKNVEVVAQALDIEADHVAKESTESYGTRHRSAFRLCQELHDALVVVVSQDGDVRFIRWKDGLVTHWDQA